MAVKVVCFEVAFTGKFFGAISAVKRLFSLVREVQEIEIKSLESGAESLVRPIFTV